VALEYQRYPYDVLVIGAGGAGLRAAIEAAASGVKPIFYTSRLQVAAT
jgi:succinate dehydrogenase/fumarate reductase flavoprotein subunit